MSEKVFEDEMGAFDLYYDSENPLWVSDNCGGAYPISQDRTFRLFLGLKKYFDEYGYPWQVE
jgi:hypothetical protein